LSAINSIKVFVNSKHDPVYALEFINESNKEGEFQKKFPGLFSNIMVISVAFASENEKDTF
jgi:hypothetical protein